MVPHLVSIVVPVYNSVAIVGETIDRLIATCRDQPWAHEIIAVDDASKDGSLAVLRERALRYSSLRVLAHARNAGQHAALMDGIRAARGQIIVMLDDDLQHPPERVPAFVSTIEAGHDVVFGRFPTVRHPVWRRPGSTLMRWIDRVVFGAPSSLAVSSYRAMSSDVADRVRAYTGTVPYVRGQMLLAARRPANVDGVHASRRAPSSYSATALAGFVMRVLLEWSRVPGAAAMTTGVAWLAFGVVAMSGSGWRGLSGLLLLHGAALVGLGLAGLCRRSPQHAQTARTEPRGKQAHVRG